MKTAKIQDLNEGDILARPITDSYGRVLLQKGVKFTNRIIQRLADFQFKYVYVQDELTEDIYPQDRLDDQIRFETIHYIRESFRAFNEQPTNLKRNQYILEKSLKEVQKKVGEINEIIQDNEEILSIMSDLFLYDDYVYMHSLNVTVYSLALANELNYPKHKIEQIGIGALLHDLGKTQVPKSILNKPGKLTDLEFSIIKEHTIYGYDLLKHANLPNEVKYCVVQHHERLNGSGYPYGLVGPNIHPYAQILAVTDVFDAVTTNRVYRPGLLPHEGLEILYSGSGELFLPEYVDLFRRNISIYPNGAEVELSNGAKGIICEQNKHLPDRPKVRILENEEGKLHKSQVYEINLATTLDVMITQCNVSSFNG